MQQLTYIDHVGLKAKIMNETLKTMNPYVTFFNLLIHLKMKEQK